MSKRGQGQSSATIQKELRFYQAIGLACRIVARHPKYQGFPLWLIDTNCGSGVNAEVAIDGSPIAAHRAADDAGLELARRNFIFCDHNRDAIEGLRDRLRRHPEWAARSALFYADNEELVEFLPYILRQSGENARYLTGAVVVDPNGWWYRNVHREGPPVTAIESIAAHYPRLDLILNLNAVARKRCLGKGIPMPTVQEIFARLNKRFWHVGDTVAGGYRYLVAVGRNFQTTDYPKVGLWDANSDMGRAVLARVEDAPDTDLFNADDVPRVRPVSRTSNVPAGSIGCHGAR